jgi:hypothetical protein
MNRQKTAEFLGDCLTHMPQQRGEVKAVVDTAIDGLKMIAQGGEWPENEAWAAGDAAWAAADEAEWSADWVAAWAAARAASGAAYWAADTAYFAETADRAADYAARAHPDPDAERARQAKAREEMGL